MSSQNNSPTQVDVAELVTVLIILLLVATGVALLSAG